MKAPKLFLKPLLFMVIMFGVIALVSSLTFANRLRREMTSEYESKAIALAQSVADSDIVDVLRRDAGSTQSRIERYRSIEGVAYVLVTNGKGEVIAHTFIPNVPPAVKELAASIPKNLPESGKKLYTVGSGKDAHLHVVEPILEGVAGYVHIGMDSAAINKKIREAVVEQQFLSLLLLAGSLGLALLFFLSISRPLQQLTDYARRVAAKDFTNVPEIDSSDEVGQLARAMQSMARHIAELVSGLEERVRQKTRELEEARDALQNTVEERTGELLRTNSQLKVEIAERRVIGEALKKAEKKYRTIFENAVEGIYQTSPSGRFLSANPALARILGYNAPEEITGAVYDIGTQVYMEPGRRQEFVRRIAKDGEVIDFVSKIRRRDGRIIWITENARAIFDEDGILDHYEGSAEDITLRKKAEDQLKRQAFHDPLTGLPNRALFLDHLRMAMERGRRRRHLFAVLYMDLDRFKIINDSLGHETGDELLRSVARVLESCARSVDTVARFGGDEFAILLEEITAPRDAITIARRILDGVRQPFTIQGHEVFTSASLGIVLKTEGYDRPEALLRDADTAMYRAKELGKSMFKVFNRKMHDQALKLLALETDLRRAVDLDEFVLAYQPIVRLETRHISGFEALIRWPHPEHGTISPDRFIPLAEDTGLIYAIDNLVLNKACEQVRLWQKQFGNDELTLNINISGKHFGQAILPGQVSRALEASGLSPECLNIEITESALMENPSVAEDILKQIKNLGANVCIDDFGTGYSSLSYLQRFPIDVVKLDRSFINDVDDNLDSQAIVRTVFALGRSLDLKIVAEGVETPQQLAFLEREGCRYVQGFLFYKPLFADDVDEVLSGDKHRT
ncbi:EAL domain-containing protein [Pseudodesulfovibrio cashew]|uniref:EAL domain-containing protein n=1 Tax=Pseudodesulfovibrio cashew TaxID=2678688 RepID=A0A6I6JBD0_9BACT|nr:EAL domain-containing protein [Pseudodesulfovibrio cashew]QGY40065.1 EAL domain-containing protein [Pseudodesulfovibrio cashew]